MSTKTLNGGETVVKLYGTNHMAEIGKLGGKTTAKRYGREYLSVIGTLGAHAVNGHLSNWKHSRLTGRRNAILRSVI